VKRKVFVTREQIISGSYYGKGPKQSYTSMLSRALYSRTIGMLFSQPEKDPADLD
jgi:hypothetical protein